MLEKIRMYRAINLFLAITILSIFAAAPATAAGKININTASVEELQTLPKIGPKTAKAIVEYRKHHPFKSVDELLNVKGIGEKKLEKLRPLVTVDKKKGDKSH